MSSENTLASLSFKKKKSRGVQYPNLKVNGVKVKIAKEDPRVVLFHDAIQKNNLDQVRKLLESGIDPNIQDVSTGRFPLIEATNNGYINIVKSLLTSHADVNLCNIQGITALHLSISAKNSNKEIAHLFLERRKANYDIQDKVTDSTPLHILARVAVSVKNDPQEGMLELLSEMVPRCNLGLKNKLGNTPLHIMAMGKRDDVKAIRIILDEMPDVNTRNNLGETPLATAIDNCNFKMALAILEHDVDTGGRDKCECTLLHYAARRNAPTIVKRLLEKGSDINAQDPYGDTALHVASGRGFINVASELLKHPEIEINKQNKGGHSPVMCAVDSGFLRMVKVLVEAKCDINIKSEENNKTALDIAEEQMLKKNKREIFEFLKLGV